MLYRITLLYFTVLVAASFKSDIVRALANNSAGSNGNYLAPARPRSTVGGPSLVRRLRSRQLNPFNQRMIRAWHRSNEESRRLDDIPGVGPALATALVASVADPRAFRSGRDFSAWIGLVPKQFAICAAC